MLLYLHLKESNIFFLPAKFDNFKDEKFQTLKLSQFHKKKLAGLNTGGLARPVEDGRKIKTI